MRDHKDILSFLAGGLFRVSSTLPDYQFKFKISNYYQLTLQEVNSWGIFVRVTRILVWVISGKEQKHRIYLFKSFIYFLLIEIADFFRIYLIYSRTRFVVN